MVSGTGDPWHLADPGVCPSTACTRGCNGPRTHLGRQYGCSHPSLFLFEQLYEWDNLASGTENGPDPFFLFYHYRADPKYAKFNPSLSPRQEGSHYCLITALLLLLFHAPALLGLCAHGLPMDCSCNTHGWSLVCHHAPPVNPLTLVVFSPVTPAWPVPTSYSSFVGKKFTPPDFTGQERQEKKGNQVTHIYPQKRKNVSC